MMFDAVTTMSEQAKAGKVRALGTTGKTRSSVLPDVPTIGEAGVPGYEAVIWLGLIAPKGTPPAIVNRLNAEITRDPEPPRSARRVGEAGRGPDDHDARRLQKLHRRRHRQVGADREDLGRQARPVSDSIALLCAGAAKGLVLTLEPAFTAATGAGIDATFGAVGALREKLLAEAPCDVIVLTAALIGALENEGRVVPGSATSLGRVRTGIAVRAGVPLPDIRDAASLRATLAGASRLLFPDPQRATAGIHFVDVLRRLGIHDDVASALRDVSRTVRRRCARSRKRAKRGAVGCTQITEINYTQGVTLVGPAAAGIRPRDRLHGGGVRPAPANRDLAQRLVRDAGRRGSARSSRARRLRGVTRRGVASRRLRAAEPSPGLTAPPAASRSRAAEPPSQAACPRSVFAPASALHRASRPESTMSSTAVSRFCAVSDDAIEQLRRSDLAVQRFARDETGPRDVVGELEDACRVRAPGFVLRRVDAKVLGRRSSASCVCPTIAVRPTGPRPRAHPVSA